MENKLIPMTDFVLEQLKIQQSTSEFKEVVKHYANFLKQPLTLGMLVPCDEQGNVLQEPRMISRKIGFDEEDVFWDIDEVEQYRAAKETVLFKGFEIRESVYDDTGQSLFVGWEPYNAAVFIKLKGEDWKLDDYNTIEDLLLSGYEIELTESALKQIGLNP